MILVVGATGELGGLIAQQLIQQGLPVRALVRPDSAHEALEAAGADIVMGDLKDPASLRHACAGVSHVITTANSSARGGADTVDTVDRAGNRHLIDAAVDADVRRFLFISNLGADPHSPSPFMAAKGETEESLRSSGILWTILQPDLFMDKLPVLVVGLPALAGQPITLVGAGNRVHSMVAMRDVAQYVIAALDHPDATNQTIPVGGPQPVSWRDVISAFEHELGHTLTVNHVPPGQPVPGMPELLNGFLTGLESYDSALDITSLTDRYAVTPTPLRTWVHQYTHLNSPASPSWPTS